MKYLLYTLHGDGLGLAYQLDREGEEVSIYFADKGYSQGLKNMIPQEKSLSSAIADKPIILFDMVGQGLLADKLRKMGHKVIGAGMDKHGGESLSDKLELNRGFGLEIMEAMKIKTPEMHRFKTIDEAIKYAKKAKGPWVIKPDGNLPTDMTFIAHDPEQLISRLELWKSEKLCKGPLILQRFIKGIEISTEVFFSNGKPILPPNSTFETKRFLVDDLGPNTGSQTSVVWGYKEKEPRLYQKTIKKMLAFIDGTGYTGPLDINTIISYRDGEAYGLEYCPRFGYNAVYAMLKCLDIPLGKFLSDLADGTLKSIPWKSGYGGAVRVSIPPYPFDSTDKELKKQIYASQTKDIEIDADLFDTHYFPLDVMFDEVKGKIVTAGTDGVILEVAGYGDTLEALEKDVYPACERIKLPGKQFRTDIARNARPRWNGLISRGYLHETKG